eukprot:gb/GFBE01054759.1/.p1 GENE.gb/GFBE01054759.1/~~gb/GFBE01054759.1/.p1  ORF type:complete len:545 (+),score=146.14 gb/GFBE01054759.1/:1-1635(+)
MARQFAAAVATVLVGLCSSSRDGDTVQFALQPELFDNDTFSFVAPSEDEDETMTDKLQGKEMEMIEGNRLTWGPLSQKVPYPTDGSKLGIMLEIAVWKWIMRKAFTEIAVQENNPIAAKLKIPPITETIQKLLEEQGIKATVTTNEAGRFVKIPDEMKSKALAEMKPPRWLSALKKPMKGVHNTFKVVKGLAVGAFNFLRRKKGGGGQKDDVVQKWLDNQRSEYALPLFIEISGIKDLIVFGKINLASIAESVYELFKEGVAANLDENGEVTEYATSPTGDPIKPLEDSLKEHPLLGKCFKGSSIDWFPEGIDIDDDNGPPKKKPLQLVVKVEIWKNDLLKEAGAPKDEEKFKSSGRYKMQFLKVKQQVIESLVMGVKTIGLEQTKSENIAPQLYKQVSKTLKSQLEENGIDVTVEEPTKKFQQQANGALERAYTHDFWGGEAIDKKYKTGEKTRKYIGVRFVITFKGINENFAKTKLVQLRDGVLQQLTTQLPKSPIAKFADVVSATPCGWVPEMDRDNYSDPTFVGPLPHDDILCGTPPNPK